MRILTASLIMIVLVSGCRGYYPASLLSPPPSTPLRHKRSAPVYRDTPVAMRHERAWIAGLDYTAGPGTHDGNHLHLLRAQITFADLTDDSTSIGRSAFGGLAMGGTYRARPWADYDSFDTVFRNVSILGLAGFYDGNIGVAGSAVAAGVGWNCMASIEGGEYQRIWDRANGWPLFIIPQAGVYLFLDADLSSRAGCWVRSGITVPGPFYLDGGISWDQFTASFGASRLDESTRVTAGMQYRIP